MTREQATQVKEQILDRIVDTIPASVVNPLWAVYVDEFNPSDRHAPCTCNPKSWLPIVDQVRARVTETLNAEVVTVVDQVIVKKEKKSKKQD